MILNSHFILQTACFTSDKNSKTVDGTEPCSRGSGSGGCAASNDSTENGPKKVAEANDSEADSEHTNDGSGVQVGAQPDPDGIHEENDDLEVDDFDESDHREYYLLANGILFFAVFAYFGTNCDVSRWARDSCLEILHPTDLTYHPIRLTPGAKPHSVHGQKTWPPDKEYWLHFHAGAEKLKWANREPEEDAILQGRIYEHTQSVNGRNRDQIYGFLEDVLTHHTDYAVPDDKVAELTTIYAELRRLRY
ncbi:hypothetical protein T310_10262 [Rasamsonia emersonii CBS 393.64]|uniref:Uncharacterized protein n=1 Tax=Rasamsonia emersonii (strain ATCC 16479 / CBS 393.64 / IMI 116815) TaxID=1408163 RepID=A0A0F4YDJ3_RASE3|nr:hypothetical protein T310_10262 [Rasamsonia emersonii CBS 393.64]KKA16160.1 hypothetical protein T310_10262 [Rasamsonia emersonii CBS 393.64]